MSKYSERLFEFRADMYWAIYEALRKTEGKRKRFDKSIEIRTENPRYGTLVQDGIRLEDVSVDELDDIIFSTSLGIPMYINMLSTDELVQVVEQLA